MEILACGAESFTASLQTSLGYTLGELSELIQCSMGTLIPPLQPRLSCHRNYAPQSQLKNLQLDHHVVYHPIGQRMLSHVQKQPNPETDTRQTGKQVGLLNGCRVQLDSERLLSAAGFSERLPRAAGPAYVRYAE